MINQQRRNSKKHYRMFFFSFENNKISSITQCKDNSQMYESNKKGFYRRVNVSSFLNNSKPQKGEQFSDTFGIDFDSSDENPNRRYVPRRLYDAYQQQSDIFKNYNQDQQSFLDYQKNYPSFCAQLALVDKAFLQSIFLTRKINKEGYYEYFVRRNGEYYLQCIDDVIPVQGLHKEPIWGLSFGCPWELLLLKAWIKEKRGLTGILQAQPFEFLSAFGLPGYSAKNIRKQLEFLKRQNSQLELKRKKQEKLALNKPQYNILAKTRSDQKVQQLGLVRNCLGYRITPIRPSKSLVQSKLGDRTIYKVHSTVPSKWIGSLSIVNKNQTLQDFNFNMGTFNLQKEFLATEDQILSVFSKFYISRDAMKSYQNNRVYQDSYVIDNALKDIPVVFRLSMLQGGFLNLNIEHKQSSKRAEFVKGQDRVRWPYIKYFLARVEGTGSGIGGQVVGQSQRGIPGEFEPNLFKYSYWDIEFMKGYHRSVNRFMKMEKGEYLIYVKIENMNKGVPQIDYTLSISSSAKFDQIYVEEMSPYQLRELVDSTIFSYSKIHGQKFVKDYYQYIYLGNSFRQIGFGFMALQIREPGEREKSKIDKKDLQNLNLSERQLGIRILPEKLKKLKLAGYYYQEKDGSRSRLETTKEPITMVSRLGYPKIIVLENPDYDFRLDEEFPQPNSIEVYTMRKKK